jgi:peptidyl-prolyl cis-trans isomerase SurA
VVDRVVATIDGEPITLIELESFSKRFENNPARAEGEPLGQRQLLDELVMEKILKKQVAAQGLTASDQQVEDYVESIRARNNLSDDQLREAIATRGLDYQTYIEQVRLDIERANLINREIRARVNVSPEEVERYYQAHLSDYEKDPRVRVRLLSLLVPPDASDDGRAVVRGEITAIHAKAAGGSNFAKLAKAYSQGPTAEEGGDLGEMSRGEMQEAFDEAAFSLPEGAVSDVIETDTGYHILKVEEHIGESHVPLAEVQEQIREQLYREAMEDRYDRWFSKDLRERHHIEIFL